MTKSPILGANGRELEKSVKRDLLDSIAEVEGLYSFIPPAGLYGETGISDVLGLLGGMMFALEVKRDDKPDTALTYPQRIFQANIRRAGGLALRVDRSNVDTIRDRVIQHCLKHASNRP